MGAIKKETKTLFFTTSPRTPSRMIPEILLLTNDFESCKWNSETQIEFMERLVQQDFFVGNKSLKNPALSARDRITRAPKALGFIDLKPVIELTPAGEEYALGNRSDEALLRQLLKFQLPSPYHSLSKVTTQNFFVKPYLEIIRLVRHFGTIAFDELLLFGMQLTNYQNFDQIVEKIETFRVEKAKNKGKYKKFFHEYCVREISDIYSDDIASGNFKIRETPEKSINKFIATKRSNLRDYADACFRYLRATEVIAISQSGHSLYIPNDRIDDVDFILETIDPKPVHVEDEVEYKKYLFDASTPELFTDNAGALIRKIRNLSPEENVDDLSISQLKDREILLRTMKKAEKLDEEIIRIKNYEMYDDIQEAFDGIMEQKYYDNPLMLEWNTWRAMTMIDGGIIEPNFKLDDEGLPLATAAGNTADIQCEYENFNLIVEVTLQSGQKQYDNEGEPVARHLGRFKELTGRETFCLFIAPTISKATIAQFYTLHHLSIQLYGGKAVIVPLELSVFRKMVEDSYKVDYVPESSHIEALFQVSRDIALRAKDESEWFSEIKNFALKWLKAS